MDLLPLNVHGAPDVLAVTTEFLAENPKTVEAIVTGLIEAAAFTLSPDKRPIVLETIKAEMRISDDAIVENALHELSKILARKPYPSIERLRNMQRIMSTTNPRVLGVTMEDMVDDRLVGRLDASGAIDRIYGYYGVRDVT